MSPYRPRNKRRDNWDGEAITHTKNTGRLHSRTSASPPLCFCLVPIRWLSNTVLISWAVLLVTKWQVFFKLTLANLAANKHKNRTAQHSGLWAVWFACYLYVCRCCVLIAIMMCRPHLSTKVNTRCGNIAFLHNFFFFFTRLQAALSHTCICFFITEQIQWFF